MSNPNQKFIDSWEKTKAKGFLKYILRIGVFFGVFSFLFASMLDLSDHSFQDAFLSRKAVSNLLLYLSMGILCVGTASWAIQNYSYKKMLESDK